MYRVGSWLVTTATLPLALGLAADIYVVIGKIAGSPTAGCIHDRPTTAACFAISRTVHTRPDRRS